jgi:hypothetical protein
LQQSKVVAEILISMSDLFWEWSVEWMCVTGSTLRWWLLLSPLAGSCT